jgi:hypothetical protein
MPVVEPRLSRLAPPAPGGTRDPVRTLVPALALAAVAVLAAAVLTGQPPKVAVAIPAAALGAIACSRWPAVAVVAVFLLGATTNVLESTTPIPNRVVADFLLVGLWLGVVLTYMSGRAERSFWLWPPLILPVFYLALTAIEALFVTPLGDGVTAYRASAWYLAAALLVAVAPWSRDVHRRIARGAALVALAIGAYCLYRYIAGPGPSELAAAVAAKPGLRGAEPQFFGSFLSANQLAGWAATMIPFLLIMTLHWRGRWRLVSLAAIGLLALALFESDVRTGIVAAAVGVVVVIVLYLLAPAFPGRIAAGLAGLAIVAAVAVAGYGLTVADDSARSERFSGIFNPGEDRAYTDRERNWEQALDEMAENPWGSGLGSLPEASGLDRQVLTTGDVPILDSSYLKVGLEQGFLVMVLFIGGLALLLAALALRGIRVRDRQSAALMIGACGALAPTLVLFYAGLYSSGLPIVAAWLVIGLGISQVTIHGAGGLPARAARP